MPSRRIRPLALGYTAHVDTVTEDQWHAEIRLFADANIYQTWPYGDVCWGAHRTSRLILKRDGVVAALAQIRIAALPILSLGIAYSRWAPLWRRLSVDQDSEVLRQALRAIRNEYTCKRGLVLRLFPSLFAEESSLYSQMFEEEGFTADTKGSTSRTILMDLRPSLDELREGMMPHWKRELKVAEKKDLEVVAGSGNESFDQFIAIYKEMVSRKQFVEPNNIYDFRLIQERLPSDLKMKVMLCRAEGEISSGAICSALGDNGLYLFGATSNRGMKSRGSYILQWKLLKELKCVGVQTYNLNGINPQRNPGTYKFKKDLAGTNGRDVFFLGQFESHPGALSRFGAGLAERIRIKLRRLRGARVLREAFGRASVAQQEKRAVIAATRSEHGATS